jgi:hypothetical protein
MNRVTGLFLLATALIILLPPHVFCSDAEVSFEAFKETAVAYMNDAFLLLGTVADGFTADVIPKEQAVGMTGAAQNRLRIVRAKFKAVGAAALPNDRDRRLLLMLDETYGCMDRQAWALLQYMRAKSRDSAERFEELRKECLEKIQQVAAFLINRPSPPKVQAPLSTR